MDERTFESRVDHRYVCIIMGIHDCTRTTLSLSRGAYAGFHWPEPTRAATCVKHYAGERGPLEMQMFAASAIRVAGNLVDRFVHCQGAKGAP